MGTQLLHSLNTICSLYYCKGFLFQCLQKYR